MGRQMLCKLAQIAGWIWDFIDKRDIDKHVTAWAIFGVTLYLAIWSAHFAATSSREDMGVAAILGAIWGPWNFVQAAVVNWYFTSRGSEKT